MLRDSLACRSGKWRNNELGTVRTVWLVCCARGESITELVYAQMSGTRNGVTQACCLVPSNLRSFHWARGHPAALVSFQYKGCASTEFAVYRLIFLTHWPTWHTSYGAVSGFIHLKWEPFSHATMTLLSLCSADYLREQTWGKEAGISYSPLKINFCINVTPIRHSTV